MAGERCPDCGQTLVATMAEFWKNPSYSCPKEVGRTECNDSNWLESVCEQSTVLRLHARLALAGAVIEAADALTVDVRTLRAQAASEAYDEARLALQAFDRAANAKTERGAPVANAQETAAGAGKPAGR